MADVDRVGTWAASIKSHVIEMGEPKKQGDHPKAVLLLELGIISEAMDGAPNEPMVWSEVNAEGKDIADEDMVLWHRVYLSKNDGDLNEKQIKQVKNATGWPGAPLFWLEDTDLKGKLVQITTKEEEWEGKTQIKGGWLSKYEEAGPSSGGGGAAPADDNTRRQLGALFDSKLRAIADEPAKPAARPEAPAPPAEAPVAAEGESTLEEAWGAFSAACPEKWKEADVQKEWYRVMKEVLGEKRQDDFTGADWRRIETEGVAMIMPF